MLLSVESQPFPELSLAKSGTTEEQTHGTSVDR